MPETDGTPEELIVDQQGGVLVCRLNRPKVRNALNLNSWLGMASALDRAATDPDVRAVVLAGGDFFFSAGGDIDSMPRPGVRLTSPVERLDVAHSVISQVRALDKPVIAAVEGYAIGAAWGLVLACDLVTVGEGAFFQAPFARRGLVADGGTAWHLTRRLGHQRAMRHLLLGDRLAASAAYDVGLVSHLCPDGEAMTAATDIASRLAEGPAEAYALNKALVRRGGDPDLGAFLERERITFALAAHGRDAAEGLSAFIDKREPIFP